MQYFQLRIKNFNKIPKCWLLILAACKYQSGFKDIKQLKKIVNLGAGKAANISSPLDWSTSVLTTKRTDTSESAGKTSKTRKHFGLNLLSSSSSRVVRLLIGTDGGKTDLIFRHKLLSLSTFCVGRKSHSALSLTRKLFVGRYLSGINFPVYIFSLIRHQNAAKTPKLPKNDRIFQNNSFRRYKFLRTLLKSRNPQKVIPAKINTNKVVKVNILGEQKILLTFLTWEDFSPDRGCPKKWQRFKSK